MNDQSLPRPDYPRTPDWRALFAIIIGVCLLTPLIAQIPFLGHDWLVYFSLERFGSFPQRPNPAYPPWVIPVMLRPLISLPPRTGLALVNGLTLSCLAIITFRYAHHTFPRSRQTALAAVLLAVLSPLTWMMMWLGMIDMILLLGLITMPLGAPLLLGKIHTGVWAALRSRRDLLWSCGWFVLSLLIWGLWPLDIFSYTVAAGTRHPAMMGWQVISPLLLLPGLLLLLTNRDPFRLIAAGSFFSPYMMPYHYYVLLPALGRVSGWRQVILWASSLLIVLEVGMSSTETKILALLFPILVWVFLAPTLDPRRILRDPDTLVNRAFATLRQIRFWLARQQPQPS